MAQLAKYFLYKHEDLSSSPRSHVKKTGADGVSWYCSPSTREVGTERPARQAYLMSSRPVRDCRQNNIGNI